MDFELSKEQKMLQSSVREYLKDKIDPIVDERDRQGSMKKSETIAYLHDLEPFGYVGTLVPESLGGCGMNHIEWAIIQEELRKVWAALGEVVGDAALTAHEISKTDNKALSDRILPELLSGDKIVCLAANETDIEPNVGTILTEAVADGDDYIINGTKMWVNNGMIADYVVVVATTDPSKGCEGIIQLLVEKDASPFASREIEKIGVRACSTADLLFENCRVPKQNLLTADVKHSKKALQRLTFAKCNAAIASVGIAQAALDGAIRYAKGRMQFGKPIGSFQLIQEMIADMAMEIDAARFLAYRAFAMMDNGKLPIKEASMAKAYAAEAGLRAASKAIQIHGAYGLAEEFRMERYFRDARMYTIENGTTETQKLTIGKELTGMSAFV